MMGRSLLFHVVFFGVAAAVAGWAWTSDGTPAETSAQVKPLLSEERVVAVTFRTSLKSLDVKVEGKKDAYEAVATFVGPEKKELEDNEHAHDGEAHASDGGVDADVPNAPRRRTVVFPAAKNLIRALTHLAPLVPRRVVGAASDDQLKKMGLNGETILTIQTPSKRLKLELGNAAYGGAAHYARLQNGDVVLVQSRGVKPFALPPERLMKRRLFDTELKRVTGLELSLQGRKATFTHEDKEQRAKHFFAAQGDGPAADRRSEEAMSVFNEVRTLRVNAFVDADAVKALKPVAKVRFVMAANASLEGDLFEANDGNGYLLKTGRWVGTVSLAKGRSLVEELSLAVPAAAEQAAP